MTNAITISFFILLLIVLLYVIKQRLRQNNDKNGVELKIPEIDPNDDFLNDYFSISLSNGDRILVYKGKSVRIRKPRIDNL
jgi:hypothetical protein